MAKKDSPGLLERFLGNLGYVDIKKTNAVVPNYMQAPLATPRSQEFDYIKLGERMAHSWVAQEVIRALIQNFMKSGYTIEPRFLKRCKDCGEESMDKDIKKCPVCSSKNLEEPDRMQRKRIIKFFNTPNSQRRTFRDILYSILYNDLIYDVWYLALENAKISIDGEEMLAPKEISILDSRFVKPVVDQYSRFTSTDYYCPACWDYENQYSTYTKPGTCPLCGYELKQTAYVQEVEGTIVARWYKEQIVAGSTYSYMPGIFGEPRGKSLWNILLTMEAMDQWFLDTFNDGRLDKLVNFPNYDQTKLTDLTRKIQTEAAKLQVYDARSQGYRTKKSLRTMFIASQDPITVHDVGISPADVELLSYYALCVNAFCGVYGVQAIYVSNLERGKSGTTPAMQIEVENKTIEDMQDEKATTINTQLFPALGITDWLIKFTTPEKKDKKRDADTSFVVAQTAEKLQNAGFSIWFDEFGVLKWSPKPTETPVSRIPKPAPFGGTTGKAPPKEKISEATSQYTNATSTEREPHGSRPATPQDEEREKK